jgi:hypothetical protein
VRTSPGADEHGSAGERRRSSQPGSHQLRHRRADLLTAQAWLAGTDVAAEVRHLARAGATRRDIPHCRDAKLASSIGAYGMSMTDWKTVRRAARRCPCRGRAASRGEAEFCIGDDRYIGDPRYRFLAGSRRDFGISCPAPPSPGCDGTAAPPSHRSVLSRPAAASRRTASAGAGRVMRSSGRRGWDRG